MMWITLKEKKEAPSRIKRPSASPPRPPLGNATLLPAGRRCSQENPGGLAGVGRGWQAEALSPALGAVAGGRGQEGGQGRPGDPEHQPRADEECHPPPEATQRPHRKGLRSLQGPWGPLGLPEQKGPFLCCWKKRRAPERLQGARPLVQECAHSEGCIVSIPHAGTVALGTMVT